MPPPKHIPTRRATPAPYFEIRRTEIGGEGWRWALWQPVSGGGRAILAGFHGAACPTREAAEKEIETFKRYVAEAEIRHAAD